MSDTAEPTPVKRPRHRFLTFANFAFAGTSIVLFIVIGYATRSNIGVLVAAIIGTMDVVFGEIDRCVVGEHVCSHTQADERSTRRSAATRRDPSA